MAAFMKLGDIKGEATDQGHPEWIRLDSMSCGIHRIIAEGAKDMQRTKGSTILEDVVLVRNLDKSSTKMQAACANGTFYQEVLIDFCTQVGNKQEPYLKYKLHDVILSSYSVHALASGDPLPTEEITLGFTAAEWHYIVVDPKTGHAKGTVAGKFNPGAGIS